MTGNILVSFHGTVISLASEGAPFHAPRFEEPNRNEAMASPNDGGFSLVTGRGVHVGEVGDSVARMSTPSRWVAELVTSPAPGRQPRKSAIGTSFYLKSTHHTYLDSLLIANDWNFEAIHSARATKVGPDFDDTRKHQSEIPLRYGTVLWIRLGGSGGLPMFERIDGDPPLLGFLMRSISQYTTNNSWILVDVTGKHPAGDLIASGDTIALRHVGTGKYLSCPPPSQSNRPYLTPNASPAAWEFWTISITP
jgi:hypothetical protein